MRPIAALAAFLVAAAAAETLWRVDAASGGAALVLAGVTAAALLDDLRGGLISACLATLLGAHWFTGSLTPHRPANLAAFAGAGFVTALLVGRCRRPSPAAPHLTSPPNRTPEEGRYRALFEAGIIGIFIHDAAGNILEANDAFLEMIGYSREEVRQGGYPPWREITPPEFHAVDAARLDETIRTGRSLPWRTELLRRNSERVAVIAGAARIASEPDRVICFNLDISAIDRAAKNLQKLSGQLLRLHDEERRRIARELHDTTAQNLAALSMNFTLLEESPGNRAREIIAECTSVAEECLRQVRSLSYYLHPPLLDELGLGAALRAYLDAFTRRTGIMTVLDFPKDFGRLDTNVESALFRIAQESLQNVLEHSGSGRAEVRVAATAEGVELTVRDFGKGIDEATIAPDAPGEGVGIAAMRERARQFAGHVDITHANPGVRVRVVIPGD
jgi:PAS domain S-box-containing protein